MMYEEELVKKAFLLYQEIMMKGELGKKENPELFSYYFEIDIRDLLERVYLPCSDSKILYVEDTLFFVPDIENDAYTYTNEELRKLMGFTFNRELYLAQFIWMNVLSEFYGDQFLQTNQIRSFIKVDEIIKKVEEYMKIFMKKSEEELHQLANEYHLDLNGMIDVWNSLEELTEKNKEVKRYKRKKYSFFLKVLSFWESEKLVLVKEEQEIKLTSKMENIVGSYYHNEERINKIKELLDDTALKETF